MLYGKSRIYFLQNDVDDGSEAALSDAVVTISRVGFLGIGTSEPPDLFSIYAHGGSGGFIRLEDTQTNGQTFWINN